MLCRVGRGGGSCPGSAPGAAAVSQTDETGQQTQNAQSGNLIDRGSATGLPRVRGEDKRIPLDVLLN